VHKLWLRWCKTASEPLRDSLVIIQDFSNKAAASASNIDSSPTKNQTVEASGGVTALSVDYASQKPHVEKAKEIFDFELEGACTLCHKDMAHDAGVYTICPNPSCKSVTHLSCLSNHYLKGSPEALVPITGLCPGCNSELKWVDVVKELTLRMRGEKDLEKLLKVKKPRKKKATTSSQVAVDVSDSEDDEEAAEMEDEMNILNQFDQQARDSGPGEDEHVSDDDSDLDSTMSQSTTGIKPSRSRTNKTKTVKMVIQDSDWDDAIEL